VKNVQKNAEKPVKDCFERHEEKHHEALVVSLEQDDREQNSNKRILFSIIIHISACKSNILRFRLPSKLI